jgi:hypothetical protein
MSDSEFYTNKNLQTLRVLDEQLDHVLNGSLYIYDNTRHDDLHTEHLCDLKRSKDLPEFIEEIFMGGGDHTRAQIALLHLLVKDALSTLRRQQQNGLQGSSFDHGSDNEDRAHLEEAVKQIAVALGCGHLLMSPL